MNLVSVLIWVLLESVAAFWTLPVTTSLSRPSTAVSVATGVYIHIPYCRQRCKYCDFAIVPVGTSPTASLDDVYTQAVVDEIAQTVDEQTCIQAIYFGGGTPSLAPVSSIAKILQALQSQLDCSQVQEITMEMDPGTFDRTKLQALQSLDINRVSLGVQSLDTAVLERLGRTHRRVDVDQAVADLKAVFGEDCNYSMDLISGVPGVSRADWVDTLYQVTQLYQPPHLSIYDLQIEQGTVFNKLYGDESSPKFLQSIDPDEASFMYQFAAGYLRSTGYRHYEVSSYARPGCESQHNQLYWGYDSEWYAFGLGATSWRQGIQTARPRAMADYVQWVQDLQQLDPTKKPMSSDDRLLEVLLKRLRTADGLSLAWIRQQYGSNMEASILQGAALGLELGLAIHEDDILRLEDSAGFLYSNSIISSIFAELD